MQRGLKRGVEVFCRRCDTVLWAASARDAQRGGWYLLKFRVYDGVRRIYWGWCPWHTRKGG